MNPLIELLWLVLSVGFFEAFIKPIATHFVRKHTLKWLPGLLDRLDPLMPDAIANLSADELESLIIRHYAELTGQDVVTGVERSKVLREFNRAFDPVRAAGKVGDRGMN